MHGVLCAEYILLLHSRTAARSDNSGYILYILAAMYKYRLRWVPANVFIVVRFELHRLLVPEIIAIDLVGART